MTTENYNATILTADEGCYLTQVAEVELSERVVASRIALSKFSSPSDWKEITKEEGEAIIAQQNEARASELPTD